MVDDEDADSSSTLTECLHSKLKIDEGRLELQHHEQQSTSAVIGQTCRPLILCDLGYGIPKEERPRREKMLAISKQLVNFLDWQAMQVLGCNDDDEDKTTISRLSSLDKKIPAKLLVVGSCDSHIEKAITDRMKELWMRQKAHARTMIPFPGIEFSEKPLQSFENAVYLSPDSAQILDTTQPPPSTVVVGLLIDRRIQVNRSAKRASGLSIPTARWPLELLVSSSSTPEVAATLDPNEPLNVDCVLEGMQQWYWNCAAAAVASESDGDKAVVSKSSCFEQAAVQALRHHQQRHPERPRHKTMGGTAAM